jgi:hypothetical protein
VSDLLLQQRYGTPSRLRRNTIIVCSSILGVVLLGWLLWAAVGNADKPIDVQVESFKVVSGHEIDVKVQSRFSSATVQGSCLFQATASDHNVVGEVNLSTETIRKDGDTWIPIRTERRATTVQSISCTKR